MYSLCKGLKVGSDWVALADLAGVGLRPVTSAKALENMRLPPPDGERLPTEGGAKTGAPGSCAPEPGREALISVEGTGKSSDGSATGGGTHSGFNRSEALSGGL